MVVDALGLAWRGLALVVGGRGADAQQAEKKPPAPQEFVIAACGEPAIRGVCPALIPSRKIAGRYGNTGHDMAVTIRLDAGQRPASVLCRMPLPPIKHSIYN